MRGTTDVPGENKDTSDLDSTPVTSHLRCFVQHRVQIVTWPGQRRSEGHDGRVRSCSVVIHPTHNREPYDTL
jgi:hypothetical protein